MLKTEEYDLTLTLTVAFVQVDFLSLDVRSLMKYLHN